MNRRIIVRPAPPPVARQYPAPVRPLLPRPTVGLDASLGDMEGARERFFDAPSGWMLLSESAQVARALFLALVLLGGGAAKIFLPWKEAGLLTLTLIAPAALVAAVLVWLGLVTYRALWFERRERRYMRFLDHQLDALMGEEDEGDVEVVLNVRDTRYWDRLAFTLLRRYYDTLNRTRSREAAARAISRDACVKAGLCNQKEWNVVNRLLVARGLRRGRKRGLIPRTFDEAWRIWQQKSAEVSGWYIDEDGDWIPKE